jgi:RNA polymerase sigma factor (TIGR02999 family)
VADTGITGLLHAWRKGDDQALQALAPLVCDELRRIARRHVGRERPGHTLQPTALVNEAFVRLVDARDLSLKDRTHFFAIASRLMRQVLVDAARARRADKRGGGIAPVELDADRVAVERGIELLRLDDALEALSRADARKARVVELKVFGGLSVAEIASALEISPDTVTRDWQFATSWLRRELERK